MLIRRHTPCHATLMLRHYAIRYDIFATPPSPRLSLPCFDAAELMAAFRHIYAYRLYGAATLFLLSACCFDDAAFDARSQYAMRDWLYALRVLMRALITMMRAPQRAYAT